MTHRAPTLILLLAAVDLDATPEIATDSASADREPETLRSPGAPPGRPSSPITLRDLFGLSGEGVPRGM